MDTTGLALDLLATNVIVPLALWVTALLPAVSGPVVGSLWLWRRRSWIWGGLRRLWWHRRAPSARVPGIYLDGVLIVAVICGAAPLLLRLAVPWLVATGLGLILIELTVFDLRSLRLPDRLTLPLCAIGLVDAAASGRLGDALIAGGLAFLELFGLRHWFRRRRGIDGLGLGDVKLAGALGTWVGLAWLGWTLLAAALLGIIGHIIARTVTSRAGAAQPFGPSLCIALWFGWLLRVAQVVPF